MKPLRNPMPIASYFEDDLDLERYKQAQKKAALGQKREAASLRLHRTLIALLRHVVMPLVAFGLCFWLYTLVDEFITQWQYQRLSAACTLHREVYFAGFAQGIEGALVQGQ